MSALPAVGDTVEDFTLPDETGTPRRLSELLADGPVVLFFYPAALTTGCTAEACHFRDPGGVVRTLPGARGLARTPPLP